MKVIIILKTGGGDRYSNSAFIESPKCLVTLSFIYVSFTNFVYDQSVMNRRTVESSHRSTCHKIESFLLVIYE